MKPIPYARQWIDEEDIAAVAQVLRGDWLTTGPKVAEFERAFAAQVGTVEAVALSSGTAALHAAMYALGIGPGDEVIVPAMTFAASANCVVFQGGVPVFADVEPDTLLLDPAKVEAKITHRTRAILAVDYAGQPCNYEALGPLARDLRLPLVADACHAVGARHHGRPVGALADLSVFSFHPVKHLTTGEGGMVATNDRHLAERMRLFRNHGIATDHRQREQAGTWAYEMVDLGYNYRITDIQCALGLSQLRKLSAWLERRRHIARCYDEAFAGVDGLKALALRSHNEHAYHLYVVQLDPALKRTQVFADLRAAGIGVNVHYLPVHLHPYYQHRFGTKAGMCPVAESAYERLLSLPMFPGMEEGDIDRVIKTVTDAVTSHLQHGKMDHAA